MGENSSVITGAVLIMVVSLALVLGLVLVLLAQLYCSLLLRRRQLRKTNDFTNTTTGGARQQQQDQLANAHPSLSSFYAQGVLQAPRNFLFPAVSSPENIDMEKQDSQQSPPAIIPLESSKLGQEIPYRCTASTCDDAICSSSYSDQQFIYICNPIYDNEANQASMLATPFETPDSSPSRLDTADSDEEDDIDQLSTPPLTPMKKLPAEACSVSLRDARSLGISGSDSNSNNNGISSSSSASPCTSPSW